MDPQPITQAQWTQMAIAIAVLFTFFFFVVNFAAAMLLGHAIIPSLVGTRHLPKFLERTRFFFYMAAAGAIATAVALFGLFLFFARVIGEIWPRWFI